MHPCAILEEMGVTTLSPQRPVILVVDDDEDTRSMYALALEEAGYIVEVAEDGERAVAAACVERPTLIVMDLSMPGIDGFMATRALRALRELDSIYIMVLSAFTDEGSRTRAAAAGCNEFLAKPMLPKALVERVRTALAA
jgi:CheY-like chemotaxis protein